MEEEEDDLYGTGPSQQIQEATTRGEELEDGEEEDDDDSDDSDIEIVVERPDLAPEPTTASRSQRTEIVREPQSTGTSSQQQPTSKPQPTTIRISSDIQHPQAAPKPVILPGDKYPAIRTSTIDLDHVPVWNGKPVTELDIDADLAESMKPWRRPGADQSDYFNYGFDEFTWAMYIQKQNTMKNTIDDQKTESKMFEQMMSGMGMPSMSGMQGAGNNSPMPPTGPAMPGAPNENEMQQMMMQAMQAQGITDPSQLDFGSFMQQFGQMGGGGAGAVPTGPSGGGQQNWGGQQPGGFGGGQQGRRGGRRW